MELILEIIIRSICVFLLAITAISHLKLRKRRTDTIGRTVYRFLIALFCVTGILYGANNFLFTFMFSAVFTERLIVYRACKKNDKLSGFLKKINW